MQRILDIGYYSKCKANIENCKLYLTEFNIFISQFKI